MPYELKDKDGVSYLVDENIPPEEAQKFLNNVVPQADTTPDINNEVYNRLSRILSPPPAPPTPPTITPYGAMGSGKAINELIKDIRYNYEQIKEQQRQIEESEKLKKLEELEKQKMRMEELKQRQDRLLNMYNFVNNILTQKKAYEFEVQKFIKENELKQRELEVKQQLADIQAQELKATLQRSILEQALNRERLEFEKEKFKQDLEMRKEELELKKGDQKVQKLSKELEVMLNILRILMGDEQKSDIIKQLMPENQDIGALMRKFIEQLATDETLGEAREKAQK